MTFKQQLCTETLDLLEEYKDLKKLRHWNKRKKIRARIYQIELPLIRSKLPSEKDFEEMIAKSQISRVYVNTVSYLFSSKRFNSKKFDETLNPKSKKNSSERNTLRYLFKLLSDESTPHATIHKVLKNMSTEEKTYFERICGINFEVFDYMIQQDKKRLI